MIMSKRILGLDIGSNSIGWALLEENDSKANKVIDLGSRIFIKAVEEKTPTPKNVKRREARLARRVIQRRARRKQRMLNYLVSLNLLPKELQNHTQPEIILNNLGNPYNLRTKALDEKLSPFELGRVFLHLVQRRGFLSNRKILLGDMADDPDVQVLLNTLENEDERRALTGSAKEESVFKADIATLRQRISDNNCRTLGEYLAGIDKHSCKRNRTHNGGHLRTDRQMYQEELDLIWQEQKKHHKLNDNIKDQIDNIIFFQRPLKLKSDRVGKCSLEPTRKRIRIARIEYQHFRYLQDINNLQYLDPIQDKYISLNEEKRRKLVEVFEGKPQISFSQIHKALGLDKKNNFNLETPNKKLKGNITACEIRKVLPEWDDFSLEKQKLLLEDLLTINKKSVLKNRLIRFWKFPIEKAIKLCLLEFEPEHGSLSLKAINKLLPYLEKGQIYSTARISAGYGYKKKENNTDTLLERLGQPPEIANPIVNKALHELRRVINAIISEYGTIDVIRVEMARDLEMNTKRYKAFQKQQNDNTKANEQAIDKFREMSEKNTHLHLSKYPSRQDKLKYRLWKDQGERCAYSNESIQLSVLFSNRVEIDHILPYSESLDDSYMNKVVCYTKENRVKGQRTPIDAFIGDEDKWDQITQSISHWNKKLKSKRERFYQTASDVKDRDFLSSQLNDTRYITKIALDYLKPLGADITTSKGSITAWLRHQWGLNDLIGNRKEKDRVDHRHHAIDAAVTACVDLSFYQSLVASAKAHELSHPELQIKDLVIDSPWQSIRKDLNEKLSKMIVSYATQRKLSGALHEETGVGFIEGIGNVSRKILNSDFTKKNAEKIIDNDVRELVLNHLEKHNNKPKEAFAEGAKVFHKDGKTLIKRVRVVQSDTTLKKLQTRKFGVKNKEGEVFKWLAYGNLHHIEILKHKESNKYSGKFVTMFEAHRRAMTGTKSAQNRQITHEPIISKNHGASYEFSLALHKNDLVSIKKNGERHFYRVRKLGALNQGAQPIPILNLHIDAQDKMTELSESISNLMSKYEMKLHNINAIGKLIE